MHRQTEKGPASTIIGRQRQDGIPVHVPTRLPPDSRMIATGIAG